MSKGYEDLDVWKMSRDVAVEIMKAVGTVPDQRLREQMRNSGISIASNISEGYERHTVKQKIQFFGYSLGSAGELKTQIEICGLSEMIHPPTATQICKNLTTVKAKLAKLIQYYESLLPIKEQKKRK